MKLLGSTENKITKDINGEKVPYLEITEVVLLHRRIVNNGYQKDSKMRFKKFNSKFSCMEVCFSNLQVKIVIR